MAIYQLGDDAPDVAASAWVADSAQIIGRVRLGDDANIWYGAVLRGDNDAITIGAGSNVQEGAVLHTDAGLQLTVTPGVTVGHQAMLHGCHVGGGSLIGIQAVVLNRARIGRDCLVGAGAIVTEGKEFPDGCLILGAPARLARALSAAEIARIRHAAVHYVAQAQHHRQGLKRIA